MGFTLYVPQKPLTPEEKFRRDMLDQIVHQYQPVLLKQLGSSLRECEHWDFERREIDRLKRAVRSEAQAMIDASLTVYKDGFSGGDAESNRSDGGQEILT